MIRREASLIKLDDTDLKEWNTKRQEFISEKQQEILSKCKGGIKEQQLQAKIAEAKKRERIGLR